MTDVFAQARARDAALTATAQAFDATELGTLDDVDPLTEDGLSDVYSRQIALTVQRVRVLSAQLAQAYAEHKEKALVRENFIWDRETGEAISAGESITALAELEGKERDRLDRQIAQVVKLRVLAEESAERRQDYARKMAAALRDVCTAAGLDWSDEETRQIARRAAVAAFGPGQA